MQGDEPQRGVEKRILIVEDNELNMKLLREVLDAYGYVTITTAEGAASLDLARENRAERSLMHLQVPDIYGFRGVRPVKDGEETRPIPVVAVTAFVNSGHD